MKNPLCNCGRRVTVKGCTGCHMHPLDCGCFPVGYDHELAAATSAAAKQLGRKGGQSKSDAKLKAVNDNLAKAREKRWANKK